MSRSINPVAVASETLELSCRPGGLQLARSLEQTRLDRQIKTERSGRKNFPFNAEAQPQDEIITSVGQMKR